MLLVVRPSVVACGDRRCRRGGQLISGTRVHDFGGTLTRRSSKHEGILMILCHAGAIRNQEEFAL